MNGNLMNSTSAKIAHNNLISSSLVPLQNTLKKSIQDAIKNTLKDLFSKAENATSNQQETNLFEQYNLLKKENTKLADSIYIITQGMPDEITEQLSQGGDEVLTLSIVEDEELEISLALTQLEAFLDLKFSQYLFAIEKRLKVLFSSRNITKANMPLGVASVCWIISQTLDLSDLNIDVKTNIIDKLKKELSVSLLSVYKAIDDIFVQAGILPNIKVEIKPRVNIPTNHSSQETVQNQQLGQQNQQGQGFQQNQQPGQQNYQGGQQNQQPGQQNQQPGQQNQQPGQQNQQPGQQNSQGGQQNQQSGQQNQQLGQQNQQGQGFQQNQPGFGNNQNQSQGGYANRNALDEGSANQAKTNQMQKSSEMVNSIFDLMNQGRMQDSQSSQASNIENNVMDETLNNLSKISSIAAGSVEVDKLKEMIIEDVRSNTGIYYPSLNKTQQNTLDVMGMFYEQVKADNSIDNNMLSSLNAINLPLIRTAISDNQFFEDNQHPAREYLEKVIYASQKWHGTSIVKSIHKFSSNVASEYDGTNKSFSEANENLESYLRLIDRRAKKAEEKWVNAAKGKEKLDISRHKVQEVVENVSDKAVPDFVKNVINYVLQDALTLSLLRHGEDSEEWKKNVRTSETIAKMSNPELIKELTPKQKIESLHHLDQTMDELGFSENDRTNTLNNVKECANAASDETLDKDIKLEKVTSINKEKQNIKKAGSVKIEELRELTDIEKSELTKVRLLPYGTIFDFMINQQRETIRRKLSWFSPVSNKALFVSLLGKKPYEKSLNAVAIELARKNIIIVKVEKKKYFESVLGNIFTKLKDIVKKSS
jgi:hypothetical protein